MAAPIEFQSDQQSFEETDDTDFDKDKKLAKQLKEDYLDWRETQPPAAAPSSESQEEMMEEAAPAKKKRKRAIIAVVLFALLASIIAIVIVSTMKPKGFVNFQEQNQDQIDYEDRISNENSTEEEIIFGQVNELNYTMLDTIDIPIRPDFWPSEEEI